MPGEDRIIYTDREGNHIMKNGGRIMADQLELPGMATPSMPEAGPPVGRKDDSAKLDLTLLFDDCPHALEAVAEVLQWAVTKKQPVPYERGSWQGVDDFQRRYRAAMQRHMLNAAKSNIAAPNVSVFPCDAETGLLELAHIATDAVFQLEMAIRKIKGLS